MSIAARSIEDLVPIPETTLRQARATAAASGRPTVAILQDMLSDDPVQFTSRLGRTLSFPVLGMNELRELPPSFDRLTFADCTRRHCIASTQAGRSIAIISDPFDIELQVWMAARLGKAEFWLAHRDDIAAHLSTCEETLRAIDNSADADNAGTSGTALEEVSLASIADDQSDIVRLVNSTIYDAIKLGASDIHLESNARGLSVKFRIDGVLDHVTHVSGSERAQEIVSRIKVVSELDIAERRIPQDGRFKLSIKGQPIDFRVSIMPSIFGEDVVIRILDKRSLSDQFQGLRLDRLGFDPRTLGEVRRLAREPYGMLLVTGPTGSGKTTTLYAALSEIFTGRDKIVTIEDPVEYQLPGILQIPVNEKKGLTFARGLRSILRHDPDKILVGEIRDTETAQIAIQSALTGHLVFTSVHANNVLDVLGRFQHMGVDLYSFVSALNGILAQRLVRLSCTACAEPLSPSASALSASGLLPEASATMHFMAGRGCGQCRGTGYRGRYAIGELLRLNDGLRELIVNRAPVSRLKDAARAAGTRFLRESALALVAEGRTTLEEIDRVTFVE
jgi:general secretion pathway protein E